MAVVVIISVIIAFLVFVMNVSLKQQGWLLFEMVRTNKELAITTRDLEDEKVRVPGLLQLLQYSFHYSHFSIL